MRTPTGLRKLSLLVLALSAPAFIPGIALAKVDVSAVQQQSAQLGATLSLIDASLGTGTINLPWAINQLTEKQAGLEDSAQKLARSGLLRYIAAGLFGVGSLGMGGVSITGAGMVTGSVSVGAALLAWRTFSTGKKHRQLAATIKKQVADASSMIQRLTTLQSQAPQPAQVPVPGTDAARASFTAQPGTVYYIVDARQQVYAPYGSPVVTGPSGTSR